MNSASERLSPPWAKALAWNRCFYDPPVLRLGGAMRAYSAGIAAQTAGAQRLLEQMATLQRQHAHFAAGQRQFNQTLAAQKRTMAAFSQSAAWLKGFGVRWGSVRRDPERLATRVLGGKLAATPRRFSAYVLGTERRANSDKTV